MLSMLAITTWCRRGHAQAAQATEPAEIVVTGTRTPEQSQRATVKTDVVTRAEAERRGAVTVADALATQPGVQVNPGAYGYLGKISPIQIQGFDLNRVLVLEDGEPVIGDVGGAIDLAAIPLTDIERIEIVTGPTSALYGSSAIGGVVNIITAPPQQAGASTRGRVEYRSHDAALLEGSAAYRGDHSWASVDLGYNREDGIAEEPPLPDLQIPKTSRVLVGARVGTTLDERVDLQLRARWLHQNLDGLESNIYPGLGRISSDLPEATNRLALHLLDTIRFGHGSSLRFSLARQTADNTTSNIPQGSPLGQTQGSSQALESFELTATIADGPRTWVLGTRVEAQRFSQDLAQTQSVNGALETSTTPEVVPRPLGSGAGYAQLQWKLGQQVTLLPGVRAEDHGRYGSVIAPRLALSVRPSSRVTVRASAGRGFRTPSAEELGFNFDHSIYGYKVVGNPDLRPERSWGVNGDVSVRLSAAWLFRAGAFMNWVSDLIDIDLSQGVSSGTVVTYTYRNFERVRTFGTQLAAGYRLASALRADATYDYLWTRDDSNHVPLSARPPHTVTASLAWSLPWQLEAYGRAHFVSDAFVDTTSRTPGYETVDFRLTRALNEECRVYVGVLNLFDVHQDPGRVGDLRPPLGRVLYAGLRLGFPEGAN